MEWIEMVWLKAAPVLEPIIQFLVNTSVGSFIAFFLMRKWLNKNNSQSIIENVSQAITNGIITKPIKVDLQSYNRNQLNEIKMELLKEFKSAFKTINNQTMVIKDVAEVVALFKAVTPEQRERIANDLQKLTPAENIEIKEPEPVVVTIEPVKQKAVETKESLF